MPVLYANRAFSTLASSITNVATSLSVAAGQGARFPAITAPDYFYATLDDNAGNVEIVKVTARSTDTFTIVRAQDGTSALAFNAGAGVELRVVKAMLDDFKTDARAGYAPLSGATFTGNVVVNTGADSRVLVQSSGTTQGQFQTTGALVRVASNNALPLALAVNGVDHVNVLSNGNVGIGTSSPAGKLSVNVDASTELVTFRSSGGRQIWAHEPGGNARPLTIKAQTLTYADDSATRFMVDASGNLGIGTNSPGANLQVGASTSGSQVLALAYSATSAGTIDFRANGSTFGAGWIQHDAPSGAMRFGTAGSERMRLNSSGNVGIGTASPAAKFHVEGNALIGNGNANTETNPAYSGAWFGFDAGTNTAVIQAINPSTSNLSFHTKLSGAAPVERMRLNSSGNVGIGTTSPTHRLDVTGAQNSVQARFGAVANRGLEIGTAIIAGTNDAGSVLNAKGATSGTLIFQTDSVERMRIDSAGNVGVNNSDPKTKLDVAGPSGVTGFTGASRLGLTVRGSTSTNDFSGIDFIGAGGGANTNPLARIAAIFGSNGSTLIFGTSNNYSSGITNGLMQLDNLGNLGVGSAAATSARTYSLSDNSQHGIYGQTQGSGGSFYGVLGITTKASNVASGGVIGISSNGTTYGILGYNDTAQHWGGYFNGSTYATGTYQGSDARLKENVQTLSGSLQKITALRPVEFDWKQGSDAGQNGLSHDVGLIAQETLPVLPDIVKEVSGVSPLGGANPSLNAQLGTFYSIDYTRLIPHLIAAIQEQQALITNLIERVRALEAA